MGSQLLQVGRAITRLHTEKGAAVLTQSFVGSGHDGDLSHAFHLGQHLFDFGRADVFTASNNDVFDSIGDGQTTVTVDHPDVAGMKPAPSSTAAAVSDASV